MICVPLLIYWSSHVYGRGAALSTNSHVYMWSWAIFRGKWLKTGQIIRVAKSSIVYKPVRGFAFPSKLKKKKSPGSQKYISLRSRTNPPPPAHWQSCYELHSRRWRVKNLFSKLYIRLSLRSSAGNHAPLPAWFRPLTEGHKGWRKGLCVRLL